MTQRRGAARVADRWAAPFLWAVLVLAALAAAAWSVIDPSRALWVAVAVLIVTCPCALSLAAPATLVAATRALARHGVLLQRLDALEPLANASHGFIDKTGTLTEDRVAWRSTRRTPLGVAVFGDDAAALAFGGQPARCDAPASRASPSGGRSGHAAAVGPRCRGARRGVEARDGDGPAGGWGRGLGAGRRWRASRADGAVDETVVAVESHVWLARDGWRWRLRLRQVLRPGAAAASRRCARRPPLTLLTETIATALRRCRAHWLRCVVARHSRGQAAAVARRSARPSRADGRHGVTTRRCWPAPMFRWQWGRGRWCRAARPTR